jgi:type II secretory pathway component PulJ
MKKSLIMLSAVAAFSTVSFASDMNKEMLNQIQALKAQIEALEKKVSEQETKPVVQQTVVDEKRIEKIEKKLETVSNTATAAKVQSGNDNLKWDVDFRTQVDNIQYKHADGTKSKNDALLTNRLWLGMGYKADDNSSFHGKLSYNKAFGDTANHSQSNTNPGYANFDWVTNENATDNTIKLKEAYWLYSNDTFLGTNVPWNASVGRRPSTDGLPINIRNNQKANSPLSHVVDVEFDGFSVRYDTQELTGLTGSWFKICGGRGLTNAKPRFQFDGTDYANDDTKNANIDMLGFIAVPYDNGQYSVHLNYAHAWNLIGLIQINQFQVLIK